MALLDEGQQTSHDLISGQVSAVDIIYEYSKEVTSKSFVNETKNEKGIYLYLQAHLLECHREIENMILLVLH
jgi:uncharacterized membrane protein